VIDLTPEGRRLGETKPFEKMVQVNTELTEDKETLCFCSFTIESLLLLDLNSIFEDYKSDAELH
jgi:hypothetical protein